MLGNGDGTFQAAVDYGSGSRSFVTIGDFNGDNALDLVTGVGTNVSVLLGNGDGTFQIAVNYGTGYGPNVGGGDFNGDGKLDLVSANFNDADVSVLLGNGDGTFQTLLAIRPEIVQRRSRAATLTATANSILPLRTTGAMAVE